MKKIADYLEHFKTVMPETIVTICTSIEEISASPAEEDIVYIYTGKSENVPEKLLEMPVLFSETLKELNCTMLGIVVTEEIRETLIQNRLTVLREAIENGDELGKTEKNWYEKHKNRSEF